MLLLYMEYYSAEFITKDFLMIRILCLIYLILVSYSSIASSPIVEEIVTSELAKELGFIIKIEPQGDIGQSIEVVGPLVINSDCRPFRTGSFFTEKNDNQIAAFLTTLPLSDEAPKVLGFTPNDSFYTVKMVIDYTCPSPYESASRRYVLPVKIE